MRFTSRHDILAVVRQLPQSVLTGCNMAAAFQRLYSDVFSTNRGSRPSAAKYVILLTDGTTSKDPESTQYHVISSLSLYLSVIMSPCQRVRLVICLVASVCLSVLLVLLTFESLDPETSFLVCRYVLRIYRSVHRSKQFIQA